MILCTNLENHLLKLSYSVVKKVRCIHEENIASLFNINHILQAMDGVCLLRILCGVQSFETLTSLDAQQIKGVGYSSGIFSRPFM